MERWRGRGKDRKREKESNSKMFRASPVPSCPPAYLSLGEQVRPPLCVGHARLIPIPLPYGARDEKASVGTEVNEAFRGPRHKSTNMATCFMGVSYGRWPWRWVEGGETQARSPQRAVMSWSRVLKIDWLSITCR